jgi:hypothetical protein
VRAGGAAGPGWLAVGRYSQCMHHRTVPPRALFPRSTSRSPRNAPRRAQEWHFGYEATFLEEAVVPCPALSPQSPACAHRQPYLFAHSSHAQCAPVYCGQHAEPFARLVHACVGGRAACRDATCHGWQHEGFTTEVCRAISATAVDPQPCGANTSAVLQLQPATRGGSGAGQVHRCGSQAGCSLGERRRRDGVAACV